jgi:hypothetical protein
VRARNAKGRDSKCRWQHIIDISFLEVKAIREQQ